MRRNPTQRSGCAAQAGRGGFTLIEMLIATALTLILVYAMAEFFAIVGDAVRDSRSTVEMSGQLRAVALRLHQDLQWRTAEAVPWSDQTRAPGYIEYQEGPASDHRPDAAAAGTRALGDADDYLALTIEARGDDFEGRLGGNLIRSRYAEVVWFAGYKDVNTNGVWNPAAAVGDEEEPLVLIRRQFLIDPSRGTVATGLSYQRVVEFVRDNDLSVRAVPSGGNYNLLANSLADLSRRENRFGHIPTGVDARGNPAPFPFPLRLDLPCPTIAYDNSGAADPMRQFIRDDGEDVMITNLKAFDLRAFSLGVPVYPDNNTAADAQEALLPGDEGYQSARSNTQIAAGGYVDLFYNRHLGGSPVNPTNVDGFAGAPNALSRLTTATYDTWSYSYEHDGIDQDAAGGADPAVNGLDDDRANGVDDAGERETSPPYNAPLRGLRGRIRIYDPGSRIVRQVSVDSDFIPE